MTGNSNLYKGKLKEKNRRRDSVKKSTPQDFSKKNKVSVWISTHPYADIPNDYFEESFSKKGTRAQNTWSDNFGLMYFDPEHLETNGAHAGTIAVKTAAGQCSYSSSYIQNLLSKAVKIGVDEITWIIILFDYEYSAKLSGVVKDEYLKFLGAFNYDDMADNCIEIR